MPENNIGAEERPAYNLTAGELLRRKQQPKSYRLIIFDLDGTLADYPQGDILPGVKEWFTNHRELQHNAIASNQGGVGLRHWMEKDGFGDPSKYPTEAEVWAHVSRVVEQLDTMLHVALCFAYRSKSDKWAPTPDEVIPAYWDHSYRKPSPGMLIELMGQHFLPGETLMVGDSIEDQQAAQVAGCDFAWAWDFFGRPRPQERKEDS